MANRLKNWRRTPSNLSVINQKLRTLSKASAKHSRSHTSKSNSKSNPLEEAKEKADFFSDVMKMNDFDTMDRITEEFPSE